MSVNLSLSPVPVEEVAEAIGINDQSPGTPEEILDKVYRYSRSGELPYYLGLMAYGIQWTRTTSRIGADVEYQIRDLSPYGVLELLKEVSANCTVQAEIPRYLNRTRSG